MDATVRKDAHGKYLDHQKFAWYVLFLFLDSKFLQILTLRRSPGTLVTSGEGVRLRQKVWGEILEVLKPVAAEIGSML